MVQRAINHFRLFCTAAFCVAALPLICVGASDAVAQDGTLLNPSLIETDAPQRQPSSTGATSSFTVQQPNMAPENAENISFTFRALELSGAHTISADDLNNLWSFDMGDEVRVADIFSFADEITNLYRARGYALSFALVPAQQIEEGIVKIEIIEGWLDTLDIQSDFLSSKTQAHIERAFQKLASDRPTKIAALERYLLLVNDLPGVTARGVISPGQTDGASSLTLIAEETPFTGNFGYNDYLSDALENDLLSLSLTANNLTTGRDSLTIDASRSPDSEVFETLSTSYETYLDDNGLQIIVSASESSTKPKSGTLAASGFKSNGQTQTIELRQIWDRSRSQNLNFGGKITRSDSNSQNGGSITSEDKTITISAYAEYDAILSGDRKLDMNFLLESGLDSFNSRGNSRQFARVDYQLAGIDGQMTGKIPYPFLGPFTGFVRNSLEADLSFKLRQMISDHPVLAGAECSFGGPSFGSAFESGAISGENCALASLKLRWNQVLTGHDALADGILQYFARLDGGVISQQGTLTAGEKRNRDAASWGLGATLILKNGFSFGVERSLQIKNSVEPQKEGKGKTNLRVSFSY